MTAANTSGDQPAEAGIARAQRDRLKAIIGGSTGNLVEWYDWYCYAAFALYFAPHFFPNSSPTAQLLNTAAIFAVGFVMRPIGAWVMGIYADRHGRKAGLGVSVFLMCLGSMLIAATPSYELIGIAAPALLVLARMLQGLSVGGEYGASATYLSEMAGRERRGFYASFQYVTLIAGQLVATCVLLVLQGIMSKAALEEWGWRIPFFIGGLLAIVVFYIRRGLIESDSFLNAKVDDRAKSGFLQLMTRHPREFAIVVLLTAGGTVAFYSYSTYMQKFLVNTSGFSRETASQISAVTLFLFMCLQPVGGWLSDRFGRRPLMIGFGLLGVLFTVPIFSTLAQTKNPLIAAALAMAALVIVTGYTSINAVVKAELFPAHIRALGVALPYAIANALFGGTAEYVALQFKANGMEHGFYWYVTGLIGVSLITYIMMRDTKMHSEIREP
jgi:MFS transporter, MHS family, alpha-ketoglutarate permease